MESYCDKCGKIVSYTTKEERVEEVVNEEVVSYIKKIDMCNVCGNKFFSEDTYNYNIIASSNELRRKKGIITTTQIEEILKKYNIGKKPLSLVLGWGEITVIRYLDGQLPERVYSDILLRILEDPKELLKYVERNKNLITTVAYKKVVGKIAELKLEEDKSKIYLIAKYIIAKMEDITLLSLQKLLYYIQGFSMALLNKEMFSDRCEAWVHGPVYREIYDRFSYYSFNAIDSDEFNNYKNIELDCEEMKLIEKVVESFGCYSGKTLEKMTHMSLPWLVARNGLEESEVSNREICNSDIGNYFKEIVIQYNINDIRDIEKYSQKVFREVNKM